MTTLTASLPARAAPPARLRRLADDVGMSVILSAWLAVLITLVDGRAEELYQQLVYAICIGVVGMLVLDSVRLSFWDDPVRRRRLMLPFLALLVVSAPPIHYAGCLLGSLLLGLDGPLLPAYPNRIQVQMMLLTLLGLSATFLLVANRERMQRIQAERGEARARAEAVERQALQAQLRLLQAQIEPHMLFNTLANLQGLIAIDPARATTMLDQLIQYLRATLGATRAETVALAEEFSAIEAYLGLMTVRMGARLAYRCHLPDALRRARVPAMLLQPLVENAVLHGLEPKVEGGEVRVEARARDGRLEIVVRDTGLGLESGGQKGGGIGIATTRERLRALYGEHAALELVPAAPQGALARLTLPLEAA